MNVDAHAQLGRVPARVLVAPRRRRRGNDDGAPTERLTRSAAGHGAGGQAAAAVREQLGAAGSGPRRAAR